MNDENNNEISSKEDIEENSNEVKETEKKNPWMRTRLKKNQIVIKKKTVLLINKNLPKRN